MSEWKRRMQGRRQPSVRISCPNFFTAEVENLSRERLGLPSAKSAPLQAAPRLRPWDRRAPNGRATFEALSHEVDLHTAGAQHLDSLSLTASSSHSHTSMAPTATDSAQANATALAAAGAAAKTVNGASSSSSLGLDVSAMLSSAAKSRPPSAIRSLFPLENIPGMLSLLAGKPNPDTFPLSAITLEIKPKGNNTEPVRVRIDGKALSDGLQYGPTAGIKELNDWLVDWQVRVHEREVVKPGQEKDGKSPWRVSVGMGSQDLLTKVSSASRAARMA